MSIPSAYLSKPSAVLRLSGEDHADFLNNQGTADLQGPSGYCRYTLWLDYKGRIHADSFVLKLDDQQMLLVSYESDAALIIEKFSKHIVVDDVDMENETSRWRLLSFPEGKLDGAPKESHFAARDSGYVYHGRRLGARSVDWLIPAVDLPVDIPEQLTGTAADELRIQSGIPLVPQDTGEGILNPVECGILSAVSFDKGCYLGQEVVARVNRLQRHSRRLVRISGDGKAPEVPFYILIDGQPMGALTSVVQTGESFKALGWLKSRVRDGNVSLNGRHLVVQSLDPS